MAEGVEGVGQEARATEAYRGLAAHLALFEPSPIMSPCLYTRLGLKKEDGAAPDFARTLKKAYRKQALLFHPVRINK